MNIEDTRHASRSNTTTTEEKIPSCLNLDLIFSSCVLYERFEIYFLIILRTVTVRFKVKHTIYTLRMWVLIFCDRYGMVYMSFYSQQKCP